MLSRLIKDLSLPAIFMGLLAAFAGFVSSFAVVLQGLLAVGATDSQAASGLAALAISMGACAIILSVVYRIPITVAWSTPGAALLVSTGATGGGFEEAVGGFVICAIALMATGLWRALANLIGSIPSSLANAMLAGILLSLCLAPVKAIGFHPLLGLPIVFAWVVFGFVNRLLAVPAAFIAFCLVLWLGVDITENSLSAIDFGFRLPAEWIFPQFTFAGVVNIAVPLFIVTMASQNIPGVAVLKSNHYPTKKSGLWISVTGLFSLLVTPIGGHAVNLAAITAAMCAGEDAHPKPSRRYWAAIVSGIGYIAFGLAAGSVTAFVSLAPPILIQAVAGLALVGAFAKACSDAFGMAEDREAAAVTFLFAASGISIFGVSGAFWGILAGGIIVYGTQKLRRRQP